MPPSREATEGTGTDWLAIVSLLRPPARVLVLVLVLAAPGLAGAAPRRAVVAGSEIAGRVAAGDPVVMSDVTVRGPLRLPPSVRAPLVLRRSTFLGPVAGAYADFGSVVDFTGATFQRDVSFAGASFKGRTQFGAETKFFGRASFSFASFDRAANFAGALFLGPASFQLAEFRSAADFSRAEFYRRTRFDGARFSGQAEFFATLFGRGGGTPPLTSFERTSFDSGATFFAATFARVRFYLSRAGGDLDFAEAGFVRRADFSTVRFLGHTTFAGARFRGPLDFDQAFLGSLDLTRASFSAGLVLPQEPQPGRPGFGHLGALSLDLDDVAQLRQATRRERERVFSLIESTARSRGDLEVANEARVRRLSLVRESRGPLAEALDLVFWFGVLGYFVRPLHPAAAIVLLLLVGMIVRALFRSCSRQATLAHLGDSVRAFLRLSPPEHGWQQLEYVAFKFLTVVLLINVGNVWPPFRELVEAFF